MSKSTFEWHEDNRCGQPAGAAAAYGRKIHVNGAPISAATARELGAFLLFAANVVDPPGSEPVAVAVDWPRNLRDSGGAGW